MHTDLMIESNNFSKNDVYYERREKHETYRCLLRVNLHDEKFPIFKEFTISTRIFLSTSSIFSYICEFTELSSSLFILEKDFYCIEPKLKQKELSLNLNLKSEHEQLSQKMSLIAIGKEVAETCEIECAWNEIDDEYENDQKYYQEGEENEEDVKYNKIEENIWHQSLTKMTEFHKYSFLALLTLFLSIFTGIIAVYEMQESVDNSLRYISEFDEIMSLPQGTETQYALGFYLLSKMASGELPKNACSRYTPDFERAVRVQTQSIASERINKYFKYDLETDVVSVDSYNPSLFKILGIEFSVLLSESYIDYSNYMTALAVRSERYLISNLSDLKGSSLAEFVEFIRNHGEGDRNSFSKKFIEAVTEQNARFLARSETEYELTFIVALTFILFFLIVSVVCIFRLFLEILRIIKLLFKVPEQKYLQRTHEMRFIISEIQKIDGYHFKICKFPSHNKITIKTLSLNEDNENNFTIESFEKITEEQFSPETSENIDNSQNIPELNDNGLENLDHEKEFSINQSKYKNSHFEVLIGNRMFFTLVFSFCLLFIAIFVILGKQYTQILKNNRKMSEIIREGSLTQQTLMIQQLATWMLAFNDTEYFSIEEIKTNFKEVSQYLELQEFFVLLFNSIKTEILEETSYQKFCDFFHKAKLMDKNVCLSSSRAEFKELHLSNFIGMIFLSQERMFSYIENGDDRYEIYDALCRNYMAANTIVTPGVRSSWKILKNMINVHYIWVTETLIFFSSAIEAAFFVTMFGLLFFIVRKSIEIKFEVLTMDIPKDLYESANFRPDLNRMYFEYS